MARHQRIACIAVGLLLLAATVVRAHDCIHDETDLAGEETRMLAEGDILQSYPHAPNVTQGARRFRPEDSAPPRIVFEDSGMTLSGYFCSSVGQSIPNMRARGVNLTCGASDTVITAEKINILKAQLLTPAVDRIRQFVQLEPISGNLKVPAGACGDVPIPAAHNASGVPLADLVIYLTAVPIAGPTLVFSGACRRDTTQRTVIAKLNVDPAKITWSSTDFQANEDAVRVMVHELLHILGVSAIEMFRGDNSVKMQVPKRGRDVIVVTRPSVRAFARAHYNCSDLDGAELENEGTGVSLTQSSHWEKHLWFEEAMTSSYGSQISGLTLAFLYDLNNGYSIDLNKAEPMFYAKDSGCGMHTNLCTTVLGGQGTVFCNASADSSTDQCTYDLGAIGKCTANVKYTDNCDMIVANPNKRCSVNLVPTSDDIKYPFTYTSTSRCFKGIGVRRNDFNPSPVNGPRCLEAQCDAGATRFKMPANPAYSAACTAGQLVTPPSSEYLGQVVCPSGTDLCRALSVQTKFIVATTTAPTPSNAPTTTTTTAAPTTTTAAPTTTGAGGSTNAPVVTTGAGGSTNAPAPTTTGAGGSTNAPAPTTTGAGGSTNAPAGTTGAGGSTSAPTTARLTTTGPGGSTEAPAPTTTGAGGSTNAPGSTQVGETTATVTPPPPTTTPAPPRNYTVVGSVTINGDGFTQIAANPAMFAALRDAFLADLAAAIGANVSMITITDFGVTSGNTTSLVVKFTVLTQDPALATSMSTKVRNLAGSTTAFPLLSAQYKQVNPAAQNLTVSQSSGSSDSGNGSISAATPMAMHVVSILACAFAVIAAII